MSYETEIKIIDRIYKNIDSFYGLLVSKNGQIIYEKYQNNTENTLFRIFSMSKPIVALAIILLIQNDKLQLSDTINNFKIDIPDANKITIENLLNHRSGVYDFSSKLYFELEPVDLFNKILDKKNNRTEFVPFETAVSEINKHQPFFKPNEKYQYSNTGYDILGEIIYVVSGMKATDFIRKNIFSELNMYNSGFQTDQNPNESIPFESFDTRAIKEQQNDYCGNAFIICTLRDYLKFTENYRKLLRVDVLELYESLYFFQKWDNKYAQEIVFRHGAGGDFTHLHSQNLEKYKEISVGGMFKFMNSDVTIIYSQNYCGRNKEATDYFENMYKIMEIFVKLKSIGGFNTNYLIKYKKYKKKYLNLKNLLKLN